MVTAVVPAGTTNVPSAVNDDGAARATRPSTTVSQPTDTAAINSVRNQMRDRRFCPTATPSQTLNGERLAATMNPEAR